MRWARTHTQRSSQPADKKAKWKFREENRFWLLLEMIQWVIVYSLPHSIHCFAASVSLCFELISQLIRLARVSRLMTEFVKKFFHILDIHSIAFEMRNCSNALLPLCMNFGKTADKLRNFGYLVSHQMLVGASWLYRMLLWQRFCPIQCMRSAHSKWKFILMESKCMRRRLELVADAENTFTALRARCEIGDDANEGRRNGHHAQDKCTRAFLRYGAALVCRSVNRNEDAESHKIICSIFLFEQINTICRPSSHSTRTTTHYAKNVYSAKLIK